MKFRNENWNEVSQDEKKIILENLPVSIAIIGILFFSIVLILPRILYYLFPSITNLNVELIKIILLIVLVMWVLYSTRHKYNKKTNREFFDDVINMQKKRKR